MNQIPDAPWIAETERYGIPERLKVKCPVCGAECEKLYMDQSKYVHGCDNCMRVVYVEDFSEDWDDV